MSLCFRFYVVSPKIMKIVLSQASISTKSFTHLFNHVCVAPSAMTIQPPLSTFGSLGGAKLAPTNSGGKMLSDVPHDPQPASPSPTFTTSVGGLSTLAEGPSAPQSSASS